MTFSFFGNRTGKGSENGSFPLKESIENRGFSKSAKARVRFPHPVHEEVVKPRRLLDFYKTAVYYSGMILIKKKLVLSCIAILLFMAGVFYIKLVKKSAVDLYSINPKLQEKDESGIVKTNPDKEQKSDLNQVESIEKPAERFNSSLVDLSFAQPEGSNYTERDVLAGKNIKYTGKNVYFKDDNNISIGFGAITSDYTDEGTGVPQDIIDGSLNTANSFKINYFIDKYSKVKEVYPGMFHVTGFDNMECSAFVSSFLIVRSPKNSNLKYIDFHLGLGTFEEGDFSDICSPKEEVIRKKINDITTGKDEEVNKNLEAALKIAKTFESK